MSNYTMREIHAIEREAIRVILAALNPNIVKPRENKPTRKVAKVTRVIRHK